MKSKQKLVNWILSVSLNSCFLFVKYIYWYDQSWGHTYKVSAYPYPSVCIKWHEATECDSKESPGRIIYIAAHRDHPTDPEVGHLIPAFEVSFGKTLRMAAGVTVCHLHELAENKNKTCILFSVGIITSQSPLKTSSKTFPIVETDSIF